MKEGDVSCKATVVSSTFKIFQVQPFNILQPWSSKSRKAHNSMARCASLCPCLVHPPLGVHCVPCTPGSPGRQLVGSSWAGRPTPALRSKGLGDLCTASNHRVSRWASRASCVLHGLCPGNGGRYGMILIDVCCHSDSTTQGHLTVANLCI